MQLFTVSLSEEAEKTPKQLELEPIFAEVMKKSTDERPDEMAKTCVQEAWKCANSTNSKFKADIPEEEVSKQLTEASIVFTCTMPNCFKDVMKDPAGHQMSETDVSNLVAENVARMCDDFEVDVECANEL